MTKEYRNPRDAETVRNCIAMLENIHDKAIQNGVSKNEIVVEKLSIIILELKKIEKFMSV